jgi:putative phage-type endonuclease
MNAGINGIRMHMSNFSESFYIIVSMQNASNPEIRKLGLGGSDAGIVLGLNPWKTRLELWQEKTGRADSPDLADVEAVQWGIHLEQPIAEEYTRRTGRKVRRVNRTIKHGKHQFMQGHIDRKISNMTAGLEIKTVGIRSAHLWGEEGSEQIPAHYRAQVVHYLAVTGWGFWDVAALIGGQSLRIFTVDRDEDEIRDLIRKEVDFWQDHVVSDVLPEPIQTRESSMLYPVSDPDSTMEASVFVHNQVNCAKKISGKINELKKTLDRHKATIQNAMGAAEFMVDHAGKKLASWKSSTRNDIDKAALKEARPELWEEFPKQSTVRTFRIV